MPIDFIVFEDQSESNKQYQKYHVAQLKVLKQGFSGDDAATCISLQLAYNVIRLKGSLPHALGALLALYEHKVV